MGDLFERFFNLSEDLFLVTNPEGIVLELNSAWDEVLGYDSRELIGKDLWRHFHPEDLPHTVLARTNLRQAGVLEGFENRIVSRSGAVSWVRWKGKFDPEREQFFGVARNVTGERENNGQERYLLDSFMRYSPSIVHLKDRESRYLYVNDNFLERMKHIDATFVGKSIWDLYPEEIASRLQQNDREVLTSAEPAIYEERMIFPEGNRTYLTSKFPLTDSAGNLYGIGGISTDISDLVKERERSTILRSLVENSGDGFGYCDSNSNLIYVNQSLQKTFGWNLSSGDLLVYLSPASQTLFRSVVLPQVLGTRREWEGEIEFLDRTTGNFIPGWQKVFRSDAGDGNTFYIGFFITDLRLRKQSELATLQNAKMASLGIMAAGIAHEINNPLTIIHGTTVLLRRAIHSEKADPEKLLNGLDRIEKTALRISKIIRGLRVFSRSAEKDPLMPTRLDEIVQDTLDLCQERFRDNAIDLRVAPIPAVSLHCRATQITQVLLNFLQNSLDAVSSLSERWISVEFRDLDTGYLELSVTDSGRGIPDAIRANIMDPFFTTKEPGRGTGLGLPISKGIIDEHGGSVSIDTTSPHTRFVILLPLSKTTTPVLETSMF